MATRKVGSRKLIVDGTAYRWRIRRRATFNQTDYGYGMLHVVIEIAEQDGTVLVLYTDHRHPQDLGVKQVIPITPKDVASWVRLALKAGWTPALPGPPLIFRASESALERNG